jgi:putative heme-binding domain-containing protein
MTPATNFAVRSSAFRRSAFLLWIAVVGLAIAALGSGVNDRSSVAVEALLRLDATNLDANPRLAQAVTNFLSKTRGTPDFVKLVQKFHLTNQVEGLIEIASSDLVAESRVEAVGLLLAQGHTDAIQQIVRGTNVSASARIVEALGNTGRKEAVGLFLPLVSESGRDLALRKQAVRSLAHTVDGATALLDIARSAKLTDDLTFTAGHELSRVPWPEVKTEAAHLFPPLQGQNSEPLPPIAELAKMKGNAEAGRRVFSSATVACINCHRVRGEGIEVGPDLSEIGTKLGKDAILESILDPNAGISFGYEAWQVNLKSGDEAYGLIASETADEVALKGAGGVVTRYSKAEITKREQMKLSMMPSGLQQAMTAQELVDLVEYLSSLRKAAN